MPDDCSFPFCMGLSLSIADEDSVVQKMVSTSPKSTTPSIVVFLVCLGGGRTTHAMFNAASLITS